MKFFTFFVVVFAVAACGQEHRSAQQGTEGFDVTLNGGVVEDKIFCLTESCGEPSSIQPNAPDILTLPNYVLTPVPNAATGEWVDYVIQVPFGSARLVVALAHAYNGGAGGTGDPDLFMRFGTPPQMCATGSVLCSTFDAGSRQVGIPYDYLVIDNPQGGAWYVTVLAFEAFSDVNILAEYKQPQLHPACATTGCAGELCIAYDRLPDPDTLVSTCEFQPEYECLQNFSTCEIQPSGNCGFTHGPGFVACWTEATAP